MCVRAHSMVFVLGVVHVMWVCEWWVHVCSDGGTCVLCACMCDVMCAVFMVLLVVRMCVHACDMCAVYMREVMVECVCGGCI